MTTVAEHDSAGTVATNDRAAALIDELRRQETTLGAVQARRAALMVEFADTRRRLDQERIGEFHASGHDARYRAGEFAVTEISLAVTASKHHIHRTTAMARRLQDEAPDVWDCWYRYSGRRSSARALQVSALRRARAGPTCCRRCP